MNIAISTMVAWRKIAVTEAEFSGDDPIAGGCSGEGVTVTISSPAINPPTEQPAWQVLRYNVEYQLDSSAFLNQLKQWLRSSFHKL